jgi:hypothetical protein
MKTLQHTAFAIALLFPATAIAAEDAPEVNTHGGIVASEQHETPTYGATSKTAPIAIHQTSSEPDCPSNWSKVCNDAGCNCLP